MLKNMFEYKSKAMMKSIVIKKASTYPTAIKCHRLVLHVTAVVDTVHFLMRRPFGWFKCSKPAVD